jgi:predicted nucleotidyltransferase
MKMLELEKVDLGSLCMALEDHTHGFEWWFDPRTGEPVLWGEEAEEELGTDEPDKAGLVSIEPISSHEGYADMEDFIARVHDPRARDMLERAIAGRGAFRRFKDALLDDSELRSAWFEFHDARTTRRALEWLEANQLITTAEARRALAEHADPDCEELSGVFDPRETARTVATELCDLYGNRLRRVLLFGSWARGDAHPEADVDVLVVLDRVESAWKELDAMEPILWRALKEGDVVVAAIPVGEEEFAASERPVLVRARTEGVDVLEPAVS